MAPTLVFDIYGTLINTEATYQTIQSVIPGQAQPFTRIWRQKQLEYSFRRGLMQLHVDFSVCTRQALEFTCQSLDITLNDAEREQLLNSYSELPAFDDVQKALELAKSADIACFAFSNGSRKAVTHLLEYNGLSSYFQGVISTADIKSFKPNPGVYAHCLRHIQTDGQSAWMISSNTFDVLGAKSAGMRAAWIQRSETDVMDPWEIAPDLVVNSLTALIDKLSEM